jgi:hypothetical protein
VTYLSSHGLGRTGWGGVGAYDDHTPRSTTFGAFSPSDPSTWPGATIEELTAPQPTAESLLTPEQVAGYKALGVHFYTFAQGIQAGWTYYGGGIFATDLPAFFENLYGSPMPEPGTCPIASGIFRLSGIWAWWMGRDPPTAGSAVAGSSFRTIPETRVCANAQVTDLFPELAEVSEEELVDFTSTPDYLAAKAAEEARQAESARVAAGGAPTYATGDVILDGGQYKEMQADGTWKVLGYSPTASSGTIQPPTETVTTASGQQLTVGTQSFEEATAYVRRAEAAAAATPPTTSGAGGLIPYGAEGGELLEEPAPAGAGFVWIAGLALVGAVVVGMQSGRPRRRR